MEQANTETPNAAMLNTSKPDEAFYIKTHNLVHSCSQDLFAFQIQAIKETIHFLETNPANACYNACEMGLGKTIQAIVAASTLRCHRILIVCPAIMRLVWEREFRSWWVMPNGKRPSDSSWKFDVILSGKDIEYVSKVKNSKTQVVITSYDLAADEPFISYLESRTWDMLIMDEAHYLKSSKAKRTKAVLNRIWPKAHYKLALSGTPFTTRVVDGYTLFRRMIPGRWADFTAFANEFSYNRVKFISGRRIIDYFGVKDAPKLKTLIRSSFYVRYTKEEVLKDLPPKVFTKIPLPVEYAVMPKTKKEATELEIEAHAIKQILEGDKPLPPIPKYLAEHRRMQGERKVPVVVEFVKELLDQDIPVVVFAWHKNVIASLQETLSAFDPAVITGETPAKAREEEVERFQRGDTLLFIGNYIAAGVGITLTASSTVVCAELDWSPATVAQGIDRLHRIGQRDTVNVYYFVVEKSIDESISNTVMSRARTFKEVLS